MRHLFEPRRPIQERLETDEEFAIRLQEYAQRMEEYDIACDMAVDEQRDRDAEAAE